MIDEPDRPGLEHVLEVFGESLLDYVRVSLPGRIQNYDAAKQMASVVPLIKHAHIDEEGERVAKLLPEIHSVPVMFVGPARGRITWPVAKGDTCLIWFCSSSIARWVLRGGEVDPGDDRRHDLNDAIAIVGLHDFAHVPTTAPTDAVVVHAGNGVTVKLGGPDANDPVALKSDLEAFSDGLDARIVVLSAGLPATATELATIQAVKAALPPGWPVCALKVKAK